MCSESIMKLLPSDTMASGLCGDQIRPPCPYSTPELLRYKHGFLMFHALEKIELLLHSSKLVIRL
jgi:hypothetical protein